jgi:hypothetical protein
VKRTKTNAVNPYTVTDAPPGTIGVVVETHRIASVTLWGIPCGVREIACYAVFPSEPLGPLERHELPDHLQPTREIIVLAPGQKVKIEVLHEFGSAGSYVFENKGGLLQIRPAWLIWSPRCLQMEHTGECSINSIIVR